MNIEIKSKEERPLLNLTEIRARVTFEKATPTKKDVAAGLAKELKAKPELLIVRQVITAYGEQAAEIFAMLYKDRKALELLERESMIKKNTFEKKSEGAAEEKPAEEAKPEAPKEKPAEKKEEEKPAEEAKPEEKPAAKAPKEEAKPEAPKEKPAEKKEDAPKEEAKDAPKAEGSEPSSDPKKDGGDS